MKKTAVLLFVLLLNAGYVFAFGIDNPKIYVHLHQDEIYTDKILVTNTTQAPLEVRAYYQDFEYTEPFNGEKNFYPPDSLDFSIGSWLTLTPNVFHLEPGESQVAYITIQPNEPFDRVHCGVIFFETAMGMGMNEDGSQVQTLGRIGSIVFVEPAGKENKQLKCDVDSSLPYTIDLNVFNAGNSFIHTVPSYYVIDEDGNFYDRGSLDETFFMPGDSTRVSGNITKNISPGHYIMVLTIDMEEGAVIVPEISFSIDSSGFINISKVTQ